MVARLIVEFDDQTAPGFEQLLENLESTDKSAETVGAEFAEVQKRLTETTKEADALRQSLANMETQNLQLAESLKAVHQENAFFRGAMQEAGRATASAGGDYLKFRLELFLLKTAAKAAATQLTGMAATAAAAVAPAVTVATVAIGTYKTLNFVLENTDQRFAAIRNSGTIAYTDEVTRAIREQTGINAKNNEELIRQLNNLKSLEGQTNSYGDAMARLQKISETTGQSLEDLGVRAESNASRIGDAFDRLGDRISEPFERSSLFIKDWWESSSLVQSALNAAEGAATDFSKGFARSFDTMGDALDEFRVQFGRTIGTNEDEYRKEIQMLREMEEATERVAKAQERSAAHFQALKEANRGIEKWSEMQKELSRISKLRSDEIDGEIHKLNGWAGQMSAAGTFAGDNQKKYTELVMALHRRREAALKEEAEAAERAAERQADAQEKLAEKLSSLRKTAEEEIKKQAEAMREFAEETARGKEELLLQERDQRREMEIEHLKTVKDTEKQILELRKQSLEERMQLELKHADTAEERARIEWQHKKQLRELDHQHAIDTLNKQNREAEEAVKKAVDAEREKIDAIKNLRNKESQSLFEEIAAKQSPEKVLEEITKKRLEESRQKSPQLKEGSDARRRMDRTVREQVRRQAQRGELGEGEVGQARNRLAQQTVRQLDKQAGLNKEFMVALEEQAKAHAAKSQFDEEVASKIEVIQETLREIQGTTRGREQRLRSQRRSVRG